MARPTINEHPDRGRIEYDLARGVPVRAIAKKYDVNIHACIGFGQNYRRS
jgi:hypothetical protein